ncbi:MAG: hypothetical protein JSS32_11020 [Verrucomicrobia bacterium]|nr:hypothetical protein [Verrucomicrobiota bacterium]
MSFLRRIFNNRTLRVDILTIFLFLISLSSLLIISFTYSRNSKSLMEFSVTVIDRASSAIVARMDDLVITADHVAENAGTLIPSSQYFSFEDERLISYMASVVLNHSTIYAIFFSNPAGDLLEVLNLKATRQTYFLSDPSKSLPPGTILALRLIKQGEYERWFYKNENLENLATEDVTPVSDPRGRVWYEGAYKQKIYWSSVHHFIPRNIPGITVSRGNFSSDNQLISIVGLDISLDLLAQFLSEEKIGKSGKAYLVEKGGKIIVPENSPTGEVASAYAKYLEEGERDFRFMSEKRAFLGSATELPLIRPLDWLLLTIVPLDDFFADLLSTQRQVVVISLAILILSSLLVIYFSKRISHPIVALAQEIDKIRQLDLTSEKRIFSNIREIKIMDAAIAAMRSAIRSFSRYIPKEIVRQLVEKEQEISLGGEKKEVVVFFSDIEGFTSIANVQPPEELMPLLTEYLDGLSRIILETRGNIDKYVGDGIMAIWGAPLDDSESASEACSAALRCQVFSDQLAQKFQMAGKPIFKTRIGIEMGDAIVGNIGTMERINYTVIGEAVNIASRLQVTNKNYHTRIMISEKLNQKIEGRFLTRPLDIVEIRGKKEKIKIYELMAELEGAPPEMQALQSSFTEAFNAFQSQDLGRAKALFTALQQKFPNDYPTQLYLARFN